MTSDALVELERVAVYSQATRGLLPHWSPRPMLPHEIRSGINFLNIDRSLRTGYARTSDILQTLRRDLTASLGRALGGATDGKVIAARVAEWVQHPPKDVVRATVRAKADMHAALLACAARAGEELRAEAAHQGVAPGRVVKAAGPLDTPPFGDIPAEQVTEPDTMVPEVVAVAGLVDPAELVDDAALPVEALLSVVIAAVTLASQRPAFPDLPITAAGRASIAAAIDAARQSVHIANGEGRGAALGELPTPSEIYASELLDDRTCGPCKAVDGTNYNSLGEAETAYPGQGPYKDCKGGARCRGTLVFSWD